ncbi:MAG: DUF4249 family protein [Candidatus Cloacimonetes bacterium]|nr:DUF4249 family protein [Candidatus Cloacimonadota bacterium]
MNKIISAILLLACVILVSCSDLTSPDRFQGDVYSLTGMIVCGSPIDFANPIHITRSSSIDDFDFEALFVMDAVVRIKDLDDSSVDYQLSAAPDLSGDVPKIVYIDLNEPPHIVQAGHTYRIEATIPNYGKVISAETTVPPAAVLVPDFYNHDLPTEGYTSDPDPEHITDIKLSDIDQRYPLALDLGDYTGALNLFAEAYCMEDFSTDLEFTEVIMGQTHADESLEANYYSSGETIRRIQIMGTFSSVYNDGTGGNNPGNYLVVKDYKQCYVFFGKYRIKVYSVDDNYYKYNYMPDGYMHGGVTNGLGYFGSASGGIMYARIVKG